MAGSYMSSKKRPSGGKGGSTGSTSAMKGGKGKPTCTGAMKGSHSTKCHGAMK